MMDIQKTLVLLLFVAAIVYLIALPFIASKRKKKKSCGGDNCGC